VTAEWRAFHLARLERLILGVWNAAISGDEGASQQALRILIELGRVTGVSRQMRVEPSGSGPVIEPLPALVNMSEAEWARRYEIARTEVRSLCLDALPEEYDS